ncbi:MAG TPA: hypothetical protein VIR81_03450, partial [Myxococcales bacterium]
HVRAARASAARVAAERVATQRVASDAREAARRAEEQKAREPQTVLLSVVSEPAGAAVEASWGEGSKQAITPFELPVPRDASVHLAFARKGYASWTTDVVARGPQIVDAQLASERPPPPLPAHRTRRAQAEPGKPAPADPGRPAQARNTKAAASDDTIPVDF